MAGRRLSRARLVGVGLIAAAAAAAATTLSAAPAEPALRLVDSSGMLRSVNSRSNAAILSAADMRPGESVAGRVTVRNTGARGDLELLQRRAPLAPGEGPQLIRGLLLEVTRAGGGLIYEGDMAAAGPIFAGSYRPGEDQSFRFRVTLQDSGADARSLAEDNPFQGGSTRVSYRWTMRPPGTVAALRHCVRGRAGGPATDMLRGTARGDRVLAGGGPDELDGRGGPDCLYGGRGADTLEGGGGGDQLRGGYGADRLDGGPGNDTVRGRQGDDLLSGGPGRDRLHGTDGDDLIRARGGGADLVRCGPGRDAAFVDRTDAVRGCERVRRGG